MGFWGQLKNRLMFLVLIWQVLTLGQSRIYSSDLMITHLRRNKGWNFLDRMTFGAGEATITFSAEIIAKNLQEDKQYDINLIVVPNHLWALEQEQKCQSNDPEIMNIRLTVNNQSGFKGTQTHKVTLGSGTTMHFILRDCQKSLLDSYFTRDAKLRIELQMLNNDQWHGDDEAANGHWLVILIFVNALMLWLFNKAQPMSFEYETDYPRLTFIIALWINTISLVFKLLGYLIYVYVSGKEYGVFEFVYLLLHSASESINICLLIFVAYGWTIYFLYNVDFDLYIPLLAMLGFLNVILTLLNKITDGEHNKYHAYDSVPSYILVMFKVILIIIFVVGISRTLYNNKNQKIGLFYNRFSIIAGIYLLSFPAMMYFVEFAQPTARKQLMFIAIELIKNVMNGLVATMFLSKKSLYQSINLSSRSFMEHNDKYY